MLGSVRLALAVCVLLSHLGFRVHGRNPGVIAVVVFFVISGYATTKLLHACDNVRAIYYRDRILRIFPAYLLVCAIAVLSWRFLDFQTYFLSKSPGVSEWLSNIIILPLNFYRWTGQDRFSLIPQAWSLALELQFYIVAPFIARSHRNGIMALGLASMAFWVAADVQLFDTDLWGYRMLPGTLFIFMTGIGLANGQKVMVRLFFLGAFLMSILVLRGAVPDVTFTLDESIGLLMAIPIVGLLAHRPRHFIDDYLGAMSYPLFLDHFLLIWVYNHAGHYADLSRDPHVYGGIIGGSIVLSIVITAVLERPLAKARRKIRTETSGVSPRSSRPPHISDWRAQE